MRSLAPAECKNAVPSIARDQRAVLNPDALLEGVEVDVVEVEAGRHEPVQFPPEQAGERAPPRPRTPRHRRRATPWLSSQQHRAR